MYLQIFRSRGMQILFLRKLRREFIISSPTKQAATHVRNTLSNMECGISHRDWSTSSWFWSFKAFTSAISKTSRCSRSVLKRGVCFVRIVGNAGFLEACKLATLNMLLWLSFFRSVENPFRIKAFQQALAHSQVLRSLSLYDNPKSIVRHHVTKFEVMSPKVIARKRVTRRNLTFKESDVCFSVDNCERRVFTFSWSKASTLNFSCVSLFAARNCVSSSWIIALMISKHNKNLKPCLLKAHF